MFSSAARRASYEQELLATLRDASGWLSTSLCNSSAFDSIAQQITQGQDILHDGTNVPGQPCDAISIGLGFDGAQIGPVDQVPSRDRVWAPKRRLGT